MNINEHSTASFSGEYEKAKCVVKIIYYISEDLQELGFKECDQLIRFIADTIRIKYKIHDSEAGLLPRADAS